jgi:Helix-turn-helix domain
MENFEERLSRIENLLAELVGRQRVKDWYSTSEVGDILGKSEYTVREWCRQHRVRAGKRACGRGRAKEWIVSHDELTRLKNEGLRPVRTGTP